MSKSSNFKVGVRRVVLALTTVSMGTIILFQPHVAQSQETVNPLRDFNRREVDGVSGDGLNQNTVFDLIHQAQQGNFGIDYEAVQIRQHQSIQDAAAEFREKQRQLLQQQNAEITDSEDSTVNPQE